MIKSFLRSQYNINALAIEQMTAGAGGTTYKIATSEKSYVLKLTKEDAINHPKLEPIVCQLLCSNQINTLTFISNVYNSYSSEWNGYIANVYEYIEGNVVPHNSLEEVRVNECASILARINQILVNMELPVGISKDFFKFMTPDKALSSYKKSLQTAKEKGEYQIVEYIEKRITLLKFVNNWSFDSSKLTYCNSHGDFTNNQIIINDKINVIDFTACCKQPIVWELTRFFFHSDKSAKDGKLDQSRYKEYLTAYTKYIPLNEYDISNLFKLYFYQLLVCDYYSQYFNETDAIKKKDYYNQANFASKILLANCDLIAQFTS